MEINEAYMRKHDMTSISLMTEQGLDLFLIIHHNNGDSYRYEIIQKNIDNTELLIKEHVRLHSVVAKRKEKLQKINEKIY